MSREAEIIFELFFEIAAKTLVLILKPLVNVSPEIVKYGDTPAW